jgi:hypothetical protein
MNPCFIAVEKFSPADGRGWKEYIRWSGLSQLTELVSLDICLCKRIVNELTAEDVKHVSQEPYLSVFFNDLDYLLKLVGNKKGIHILATMREPAAEVADVLKDGRFEFLGYDLLESGISSLTNCGGFDKSFSNSELSTIGLIKNFVRAQEIQKSLKGNYPEEPHAQTTIWALWKMNS